MRFLQLFEDFEDFQKYDDTLMIFDFDDTIVDSPRFEEQIKDYLKERGLKESLTVGDLLDEVLSQISVTVKDLSYKDGRYYVKDPNNSINIENTDWVRNGDNIYLTSPEKYYYSDLSFPDKLTDIAQLYKSVKNKAIVTARYEKIRYKVEEYLNKLGLDYPNYGLYCFPGIDDKNLERASIWKAKTVVRLIKEHNFKKARFYDDTSKTILSVEKHVREVLPQCDFKAIKVIGWWT